MITVIAQSIGIVALVFNALSFQCKKNKNFLLVLSIGNLLFAINFLMLGSYVSAGYNLLGILRTAVILNKKTHNNAFFIGMLLIYTIVTIFTYDGIWTLFLLSSQLLQGYTLWYKDGGIIRKVQLCCVSPIWLINNIFFTFTIGGILTEIFTITSVIVSFIRYGKDFDKA